MATIRRAFQHLGNDQLFQIEFEEHYLGEPGAFGAVHRIISVDSRKMASNSWVIKILNRSSPQLRERLGALVGFFAANHLNTEGLSCVPAAVFQDTLDSKLAIVMRHAPGADLETGGGVPAGASLPKRLLVAAQLAGVVDRLHRHDVTIGDLAHDNLIIDPRNWALYIIDLDGIRFFHNGDYPMIGINAGKGELSPPEAREHEPYTIQMDLWGLSILLHYLLTDNNPMSTFGLARTYGRRTPSAWPPNSHPQREAHLAKLHMFGEPLKEALVQAFTEGRVSPRVRRSASEWKVLLDEAQQYMYECECSRRAPFVALALTGVLSECPRCGSSIASRSM